MQGLKTKDGTNEDQQDKIYVQITSIYFNSLLFRVELPVYEPNSKIPDDFEEDDDSFKNNLFIVSTYITDSNFLFALLETKVGYNLYSFDLQNLDESIKND